VTDRPSSAPPTTSPTASAEFPIVRRALLAADLGGAEVARVEIRQIDLEPAQQTGLHRHASPVVGYIVRGTIRFQIEGGPLQSLSEGSAFFEPPGIRILHFDNASDRQPARFIAFYLLRSPDQALIEMLA
jgi:quercetin dioxygenase-like cupin family protein